MKSPRPVRRLFAALFLTTMMIVYQAPRLAGEEFTDVTITGNLSVSGDADINGLRVGRGGGGMHANSAYGEWSLLANTTGSYNTAAGYFSLQANTTGWGNSAFGANSLAANAEGGENSAFGNYTLPFNTTGYGNTALGAWSLYYNSTGHDNIAVGRYSLFSNVTGGSNVAIGANAGGYTLAGQDNADPNCNVYLGAESRASGPNDHNAIVIGYAAVSDGANTTVIGNSDTLQTRLFGELLADRAVISDIRGNQIHLAGIGGGIYADGTPVFTVGSAGNLVFGNHPLSITNTTASDTSGSGALTVAGGMGVALDSFINGIRVGRGAGAIATNTAYGASSLQANTTGAFNTAAGYRSLSGNTTGTQNTAAGANSMYLNSTGSRNVASGHNSLWRNTSGAYNSATGFCSLASNSSGSHNTAVGNNSLVGNTTGASNVAIGSGAGGNNADGGLLATANNSIYIGANSRGFSNLDNNAIVIGNGAIGKGANTTVIGNSSTLKTHLYGMVSASGFNVNNIPVLTAAYGQNSALSGNGILAVGPGAKATKTGAIAIGDSAQASAGGSIALGYFSKCGPLAGDSISMTGGVTAEQYSLAASYGEAYGALSVAIGVGVADADCAIALGGYDWLTGPLHGNLSSGENSTSLGGVGNQAMGFSSLASGFWTKAAASHSLALGSLNLGQGTSVDTWVESDPLFELGNGVAPRSAEEPDAATRSNAITTLKNGRTTLTSKAWLAEQGVADPDPDSGIEGVALVVEGHTRLRGRVIIEQAQGDISMGIYGP